MPNVRISREVDGERVEGVARPVFIRSDNNYFLTDLRIYADGSIYCWEWVDLAGLKARLASGRVATSLEEGARVSVHHLASWRIAEPQSWIRPEWLLGEVADEIDKLNGRPDSTGRCLLALGQYLDSRSEQHRASLQAAYDAIPQHLRVYALGDMDHKDMPLRVLCAGVGEHVETYYDPGVKAVTEEMHQRALDYFADRRRERDEWEQHTYPDGPEGADSPTLHLNQVIYPKGWPDNPGVLVLRNEYPAAITVNSVSYPTVVHAYWALAVADAAAAEQIRTADHQRPDLRPGIGGRTDPELPRLVGQAGNNNVVDGVFDEDPRPGVKAQPVQAERPEQRTVDCPLEVRVREDDAGRCCDGYRRHLLQMPSGSYHVLCQAVSPVKEISGTSGCATSMPAHCHRAGRAAG